MEPLLTTEQAAEFFGIAPKTLENWRWLRRGPRFVHLGTHVRYRPSALEAWLEARASETERTWEAS